MDAKILELLGGGEGFISYVYFLHFPRDPGISQADARIRKTGTRTESRDGGCFMLFGELNGVTY